MPLSSGQIVNNRYRIETLLGQGGFGAVYCAWDLNLDKPLALKENLDTTEAAQRQFMREARILSNLSHPNLPRVTDHFIIPGQGQYLVMDFIEGKDLGEMLQQSGGPLPQAHVLDWIEQVCDALIHMHSQNPQVIHRDIKPANIKITPGGKAILVDFGIAKVFDPNLKTTIGARAVTPGYSPIEQYGRGGRTDARTDVYALGATLYNLLTGQEPVEAPERNLGLGLPAPRSLNAMISPYVDKAIMKSTEMLPEERYQSMAEFKNALTQASLAINNSTGDVTGVKGVPTLTVQPVAATPRASHVEAAIPVSRRQLMQRRRIIGLGVLAFSVGIVLALTILGLTLLNGGMSSPTPDASQIAMEKFFAITQSTKASTQRAIETDFASSQTAEVENIIATRTAQAGFDATQTAAPTPTLTAKIIDEKGVPMALIPAGEFQMGSENGGNYEKPVHSVSLDAFYIDVYEVTNALYAKCVSAGACQPPTQSNSSTRSNYYGNSQYTDYPVIYVTWEKAKAYCEWHGGSLPSEAQWEKAARGGLQGMDYPWGNEKPVCKKGAQNGAKFADDAGCNPTDTEPVGSYSPNGYGLFDMVGNVWEWGNDWYQSNYYAGSPGNNPTGPSSGDYKTLRGGSFGDVAINLRVAVRYDRYAAPPTSPSVFVALLPQEGEFLEFCFLHF